MQPEEALGSGWRRYRLYRAPAIACTIELLQRVPWPRYSVYRGAVVGISGRRYIAQAGVREHSEAVESVRKCMRAHRGAWGRA